jgi:hypothetical protein
MNAFASEIARDDIPFSQGCHPDGQALSAYQRWLEHTSERVMHMLTPDIQDTQHVLSLEYTADRLRGGEYRPLLPRQHLARHKALKQLERDDIPN